MLQMRVGLWVPAPYLIIFSFLIIERAFVIARCVPAVIINYLNELNMFIILSIYPLMNILRLEDTVTIINLLFYLIKKVFKFL